MAELGKVKQRIEQLRAEINHHNYRYHVLDLCLFYLWEMLSPKMNYLLGTAVSRS